MDFSIKLSSGFVLKGVLVSPGEDTRAVVVMVHGPGEHIRRYMHIADIFRISLSLFHCAINAGQYVLNHASETKLPVLLLHGSNDLITSPDASREFALNNKKTELKIFEGGYHELHNEPFKKEVFDYIIGWIYRKR